MGQFDDLANMLNAVTSVVQVIVDIAEDFWEVFQWILEEVIQAAQFVYENFIRPIVEALSVFKVIKGIIDTVWKTIQAGLERIIIDLRDLVEYLEFGLTPLTIAYKILSATVKKAMIPAIRKGVEAVKNWIPVLKRVGTFVGGVLNVVLSVFFDTLSLLTEPVKFLIDAFDSLASWISGVAEGFLSWIDDLVQAFNDMVSWVKDAIDYVTKLKDKFVSFLDDLWDKILNFFGGGGGGSESASMVNPPQNVFKLDLRDAVVDNKESLMSEIIEQASMRLGF